MAAGIVTAVNMLLFNGSYACKATEQVKQQESMAIGLNRPEVALKDVNRYYEKCKSIEFRQKQKEKRKRLKRLEAKRKRIRNTPIYKGRFKITYYWIGEDSWGYKTALGVRSQRFYTVAVDPDVIPLNSKIIVGNDIYWAVDTGSAVNGNVVDIFSEEPMYDMHHDDVWLLKKGASETLSLKYKR